VGRQAKLERKEVIGAPKKIAGKGKKDALGAKERESLK